MALTMHITWAQGGGEIVAEGGESGEDEPFDADLQPLPSGMNYFMCNVNNISNLKFTCMLPNWRVVKN